MFRKALLAGLLAFSMVAVTGCNLYFGDPDDDDGYTYCDASGCYWCDDWGCYPDDPPNPGWDCTSNWDCAAGCYCSDYGYCEEAGFCSSDFDCPEGFECELARSSCVPDGSNNGECTSNDDCPMGSYCDPSWNYCVATGMCTNAEDCGMGYDCVDGNCIPVPCTTDDQCFEGCVCNTSNGMCEETGLCGPDGECPDGFECDATRNTCAPCDGGVCDTGCQIDADCTGEFETCTIDAATGVGTCAVPDCTAVTDESICVARVECFPVYAGQNCTNPNGETCENGDSNCICETFSFAACVAQ